MEQALRSLDRADEAAALVAVDGLTTTTKMTGAVRANPLLKIEREARADFARVWSGMLSLQWTTDTDGRMKWDEDWDEDEG